MAAVLDAMVPYVKKLITDMAEEEVSMLLGVSGEIEKLEGNMEGIKAFLADAERRRITDQSVQRWVRKLKDAMYDATDIIDLCQLEADKRRGSTEDGSSVKKKVSAGCFQSLLFCMRNPVFAHKIGSRIKELNQRLDGIHKEADRFKFSINLGSNPEPRKLTDAERSMQKTTSEFNESAIVGEKIQQDTRELAQLLITGGLHDIKVVSIVGTGGMGKTTLAQKIFNEVIIQEHFKVKVWLSITQHFDEIELLKTAIEHVGGVHGGTQDKTLLTRTLTNTLSTGRFLLVMDDVWSDQAWSHVLSVPIRNASQKQQGNWVLITTRLEDMAQQMGASFYQHHVSPLNEEDAWSLLTKQLPPSPNQLRRLTLHGLENVSASSLVETAKISSKEHLEYLDLYWSSSRHLELRNEIEKQQQQQQVVEEVLEKLCPPPRIHHLGIQGYFGRTLPNWMMVVEACAFKSLSIFTLKDLPCCTKLPDGLCRLPSLKTLGIADAPAIKSVGSEFQGSSSSSCGWRRLCEWEEWDWEEQTVDVAMHALEYLEIIKCKLSCFPPGLANNKRHALRQLRLHKLSNLSSVENFPSIVKLVVVDCPKLKRFCGLSRLHKIRIVRCRKLKVSQGVPVVDNIEPEDGTIERLPGYLACVNPRFLKLTCSKELHDSIISGSSSECEKIRHITKHDINYI
uniref:AAA+ ATPase domain-containing protein n=1 Tax=Setaria viridis TaxID=4556 RepID=A0A4U6TLQ4_SETVI|nr:hypothetical protein SEVIR_8G259700v2 [Setaria viridis]